MAGSSRTSALPADRTLTTQLPKLRRFLRSPKGYLLIALAALVAVAAPFAGFAGAVTVLTWAVIGAVGMELVLVRLDTGSWRWPSSALLTGLIVGGILGPHEPWYVAFVASVLAIDAKHVLRAGRSHIFNPAAVGLLAAYVLFGSGQSWWAGLPDLPAAAIVLLLVAGYLVAARANKLPAALVFLAVYAGLFTATTFVTPPSALGEIFRPPFVNAALFFAFFMVTDPPTSPVSFREQLWFGAIVAVACFDTYIVTRAVYYLPLGILIGNGLYAVWRVATERRPARRVATATVVLRRAPVSTRRLTDARPPALPASAPDAALEMWRRPAPAVAAESVPSDSSVDA